MDSNKENDQNKDQGKQSTAETDVTYNLDSEELRKSATTSMPDVDSGGSIGTGGGRVEQIREDGAENTAAGS